MRKLFYCQSLTIETAGESISSMEILEDLNQWKTECEQGCLAHYKEPGQFDMNRINRFYTQILMSTCRPMN